MKKLLLIDGNSMLFRGFYATYYTNMMKTSNGVYTNAVYAFANMLEKAINTIKPDYCAVAFDKGKHTFRHELSSDYKGGRRETPEELIPQFKLVRDFLSHYPIPYFEFDDIEADDIIGSLAKKYPDVETCILSSDKDLLQIIDASTSVYLMKKGISEMVKMDEKALLEEYELEPSQIVDLKGLMGDASDNIKGVKGIGPKTAVKLLKDYKTCEGIYEHIDELKGKVKENLLNDQETCFLSKKLATIKTDVAIDLNLEDLKMNIDLHRLNDFYKQYEMFSLVQQNKVEINNKEDYKVVKKISKALLQNDVYIHFESSFFSYYEPSVLGLSFSDGLLTEFIYLEDLKKDEEALSFLKSDAKKIVYDYKALKHASHHCGFELNHADDLMLIAHLNNNYMDSLEAIFAYYKKEPFNSIGDLYGTIKKPLKLDADAVIYNACHIASTAIKIYLEALEELKEKDCLKLYQEIELPLSEVLFEMECDGIYCDESVLDEISNDTFNKMNFIADEIFSLVSHSFNLNSPKQLAEVLFDELGLPDRKKRSTSVEVLQKLEHYHPIISLIMEYRKYSKLYSTYAEGLKKYIKKDHRIHTIFSQTITQTGRLSSYDPNLQNISVKDEEGRLIRKAFKPSKDCLLISSDYSQIELRVLASLSREEKMIEAFNNGIDIHTKTAIDVFGLKEEDVNDQTRRQAKAVNFGVVYGISDFGLSQQASLTIKEAKAFIEEYFKTYPRIKEYMEEQILFCKENGYVKTMMNRRRYIKEIQDSNFMVKEFGKRAAMNSPIQGSAADLIKMAMISIYRKMKEKNVKSKMILQVHDELIFDVYHDEKEIMEEIIKEGMLKSVQLNVRLESSLAHGLSWYEAK